MAESDALSQQTLPQNAGIETADIVLGVATYNGRETVAKVIQPAVEGLAAFSSLRAVLVHADGGSRDGTVEMVRELVAGRVPLLQVAYPVYPVHKLSMLPAVVPGRGEALRAMFALASKLGASVFASVDSGLLSMTPEWVERLVRPVLDHNYDLVTPWYQRHKFDGAINKAIVYPLTRALYGKRIRQPIGGEGAFSARLIKHCADQESWDAERALSTDMWIASEAISGGFRVCQALLGPRILHASEVAPDLSTTLALVLSSIFERVDRDVAFWQKVRGSETVPVLGSRLALNSEPVQVNAKRMLESFRLGCRDLPDIWGLILPPASLLGLKKLARQADEQFHFPDEVWARIVYDFLLGYHLRVFDRDQLLRALTPMYLGWLASFVMEMQDAGAGEAEERLERLCLVFEGQKRYLISRWRWPDRFNP